VFDWACKPLQKHMEVAVAFPSTRLAPHQRLESVVSNGLLMCPSSTCSFHCMILDSEGCYYFCIASAVRRTCAERPALAMAARPTN
jgi:hypothetical protein